MKQTITISHTVEGSHYVLYIDAVYLKNDSNPPKLTVIGWPYAECHIGGRSKRLVSASAVVETNNDNELYYETIVPSSSRELHDLHEQHQDKECLYRAQRVQMWPPLQQFKHHAYICNVYLVDNGGQQKLVVLGVDSVDQTRSIQVNNNCLFGDYIFKYGSNDTAIVQTNLREDLPTENMIVNSESELQVLQQKFKDSISLNIVANNPLYYSVLYPRLPQQAIPNLLKADQLRTEKPSVEKRNP